MHLLEVLMRGVKLSCAILLILLLLSAPAATIISAAAGRPDTAGMPDSSAVRSSVNGDDDNIYGVTPRLRETFFKSQYGEKTISGILLAVFIGVFAFILLYNKKVLKTRINNKNLQIRLQDEKLEKSQSLFSNTVENAPVGIVVVDCMFCVTVWNGEMERMTGIKRCDIVGAGIFEQFSDYPDTSLFDRLKSVVTYGETLVLADYPIYSLYEDDVKLRVNLRARPLYATDKRISGMIASVEDMTGLKRQTRLFEDALDIFKSDPDFLEVRMSNVEIVQFVNGIVTSVASYIKDSGLSFDIGSDFRSRVVACDPEKLERVLLNLLSNAIKFAGPEGRIGISISEAHRMIEIIVSDTGSDMHEDRKTYDHDKKKAHGKTSMLKLFFLPNGIGRRSLEFPGSGGGLSLSKSLMELQGGSIRVENLSRKGSMFIISIPDNHMT